MKTRIEILTQKPVDEILKNCGYIYDKCNRYLFDRDNIRYKVAWIHRNSWNQITYIDLITV